MAALAAVLVVIGLAGCSGGTTDGLGLEEKSAADVVRAAAAALRSAKSVHVTGTAPLTSPGGREIGRPATIDARIQGGSSRGTLTMEAGSLEFIVIGDADYIRADEGAMAALGAPREIQRAEADRWVRLSPKSSGISGFTLEDLLGMLTAFEDDVEPDVRPATVDGEAVVVVTNTRGGRLYVANTAVAYPRRIEGSEAEPGDIVFTDYDVEVEIAAPIGGVSVEAAASPETGSLTDAERAWLQTIGLKRSKIEDAVGTNVMISESGLRPVVDALRSCSVELAATSPPTTRLQPVHALVQQACGEYDKGAACFDAAAAAGVPFEGSAEARALDEAIDCGFAGFETGDSLLVDAEMKGFEIQRQEAAR